MSPQTSHTSEIERPRWVAGNTPKRSYTRQQAKRWHSLATVPEGGFNAQLEEANRESERLTTGGMLALALMLGAALLAGIGVGLGLGLDRGSPPVTAPADGGAE